MWEEIYGLFSFSSLSRVPPERSSQITVANCRLTTSVARCRREKSGGKKQVGLLASCSTTEYYVKQIYKGNSCEMMTQISCTVISCELQFCVHVLEFTCNIFIWNLCILFSNEFHAKSDTYMQNTWQKEGWQCKERNLCGVFWFVRPDWPYQWPLFNLIFILRWRLFKLQGME